MSRDQGATLPVLPRADRITFELPDVSLGGYLWMPLNSIVQTSPTMVVLLHGWGEDAADLVPVGRKVANMGLHAISLSMRGWRGSTGVADYGRSDPGDIRKVATAIRQRFGMKRVVLIGFSMGGLVALLTAAAGSESSTMTDIESSEGHIDGVVAVSSPVDLRSFYADTAFEGVRRYFDNTLTDSQWDLCSPLHQTKLIVSPVLMVVGPRDDMCPPDQGHRLVGKLNSARILEIEDMGHHPSNTDWNDILQRAQQDLIL